MSGDKRGSKQRKRKKTTPQKKKVEKETDIKGGGKANEQITVEKRG